MTPTAIMTGEDFKGLGAPDLVYVREIRAADVMDEVAATTTRGLSIAVRRAWRGRRAAGRHDGPRIRLRRRPGPCAGAGVSSLDRSSLELTHRPGPFPAMAGSSQRTQRKPQRTQRVLRGPPNQPCRCTETMRRTPRSQVSPCRHRPRHGPALFVSFVACFVPFVMNLPAAAPDLKDRRQIHLGGGVRPPSLKPDP